MTGAIARSLEAPRAVTHAIQGDRISGPNRDRSARVLLGFTVCHLALQLLLLSPGLSTLRSFLRIGDFGINVLTFLLVPGRAKVRLSVKSWCTAVVVVLIVECAHPDGGGLMPSLAQNVLYFSILASVFWVPRLVVTARTFQRLMLLLWLYYSAGAVVGVLQAYFPGHFQPELSSIIADAGRDYVAGLQIKLSSGEHIFRPMGLTNMPGGAAYGALFAVLFGAGVTLLPKSPFLGARFVAVGTMLVGAMCLYLCQVRSMVVMTGICLVVMLALLAASGRVSRLLGLLGSVAAVLPVAFFLAVSLAGATVTDRLGTLLKSDAGTVYYQNRGRFLDVTFNDYLPQFPLGAGLGRWGMVARYFPSGNFLWVEIQWTAWLFDGGIVLVLIYFCALIVTTWACLRVARSHVGRSNPLLGVWGCVVVAYNVGTLALCFNYTPFVGTAGLEFWLINAALLCAASDTETKRGYADLLMVNG